MSDLEISLLVPNIFEGVGDDGNPHVDEIAAGNLEHLLGELLPVLVDLLEINIHIYTSGPCRSFRDIYIFTFGPCRSPRNKYIYTSGPCTSFRDIYIYFRSLQIS